MRAAIIGAGQIGQALATRLAGQGWQVDLLSRSGGLTEWPIRHFSVDRTHPGALAAALGEGADLLVDTVAFDERDATQLLELQDGIGQIVAISSSSVYRDAAGRTLDEARANGFPELPDRMTEAQPTVAPGPATYSTRKVAMENTLLAGAHVSAAVIRAGAVYGIGSRSPREWWVVKRLLDGRRRIPLAFNGESRFHPIAAANLAALIEAVAAARATGPFNAGDPGTPTAAEIGSIIAARIGVAVDWRLLDGSPRGTVGAHPWVIPRPFTLSTDRAVEIGYGPVGDYTTTAGATIDWLAALDPADWQARFPGLVAYGYDLFDYAAEDAALAAG